MHTTPEVPPTPEPPKDMPPDEFNPVLDPPINPAVPDMPEPREKPLKMICSSCAGRNVTIPFN